VLSADKPEVTVVVINWNGGSLLLRPVGSVLGTSSSRQYGVLVVDNGSSDDSVAQVHQ
jgi:GT2 family glycosyltransferase